MTDKKRRTVTTIETHEVWIVRRGVLELPDDSVTHKQQETEPQPAVPTLAEDNNTPNENQLLKLLAEIPETDKNERGQK